MNSWTATQRLAIALLASLGVAFVYATYEAIDSIVAEQSHVQQRAVSPVFKLVRDELLRPLYIAETFASSIDFTTSMDSADLDEQALLDRLEALEKDLGLTFFVASDKTRRQYFSDGRTLNLVEGEVWWYFQAKKSERDFMADLGQIGDVHLYYDVKITGSDGEFLGYVGVGKSVQNFLDTFDRYKAMYGYNFLFVNDKDEIMLSSLPGLVVKDAYIPTLQSTEWFGKAARTNASYDSEIVEVEEEDFLVSAFAIDELGWRLLLLVPLEARQAQITKSFFANALATIPIIFALAGSVLFLLVVYKRRIEKTSEVDALTGLPNRIHVQRRFDTLRRSSRELCVIIIDLDNFKAINDAHGHDAGDRVLKAATDVFRRELRDEDTVSRWGGEEFVMLIPASSIEIGRAIAERARRNLESLSIEARDARISVTASFGVAFGAAHEESLDELLTKADEVLYKAKEKGRNRVTLYRVA